MKAQFTFLGGARLGEVETLTKAYIGLGRHPLSDVRFDAERDLDVSSRHAAILQKADGYYLQDLGSRNGTYVNGRRIDAEVRLADGDVIAGGRDGPAVRFQLVEADAGALATTAAEAAAGRASNPRHVVAAARSSTASRIAAEVARQTRNLRRTTKVLLGILAVVVVGFGLIQWRGTRTQAAELAQLEARADSLNRAASTLLARFAGELEGLRAALTLSQDETARLRRELATTHGSDAATVARLRAELDAAERRQQGLAGAAGVDYRAIARRNADAVAIVLVKFSDTEMYTGTAFAVDSQGTLVTNKHVLRGMSDTRTPQQIGVMFAGSRQNFPAYIVGVSPDADVGVVRVAVAGATPAVAGIADDGAAIERGAPIAMIGYPLGFDLPMERIGRAAIADPTLTVGTVSKVLADLVQVDGYGTHGSSGSPLFDRDGRVVGMVYGGEPQSQGRILYAVPGHRVAQVLRALGVRFPS